MNISLNRNFPNYKAPPRSRKSQPRHYITVGMAQYRQDKMRALAKEAGDYLPGLLRHAVFGVLLDL